MKVFEVVSEYESGKSTEIIKEVQYVTSEADTLESVVVYFAKECEQYETDLKGVREVLTVVRHINLPD